MSTLTFKPEPGPFPKWMGPFSPAKGTQSGFRVRQDRLGTWVGDDSGKSFWTVVESKGAREIVTILQENWGGGRVLFLPNGFVVKPLQENEEVGQRALIGRIGGAISLERPSQPPFDMSNPGALRPGDPWPGPATTGLACVLKDDGSLVCNWYHPTALGRDDLSEILRGPDQSIASGFRAARAGSTSGRVRVTVNGHIITLREESDGNWASAYVGRIDPESWPNWNKWITKEHV